MLVLILKNSTFRKMLKAQLEEEGFEVLDFEDADEAVGLLGRNRLAPRRGDLIVIDLMDGEYTLDRLKDMKKRGGDVPFLVLKGAAGLLGDQLKKEGFNFILERPFSIGNLVGEVRNVLAKSSR